MITKKNLLFIKMLNIRRENRSPFCRIRFPEEKVKSFNNFENTLKYAMIFWPDFP